MITTTPRRSILWRRAFALLAAAVLLFSASVFDHSNTLLAQGKGKGGGGKDQPPPPSYQLTFVVDSLFANISGGRSINESGDVVGGAIREGFTVTRGFVYFRDEDELHDVNDLLSAEDLELGWEVVELNDINSSRQMCGRGRLLLENGAEPLFAVRLTPQFDEDEIFVEYRVEALTEVGNLGDSRGMNEWGDVTGRYFLGGSIQRSRAFVYTDEHSLLRLDSLAVNLPENTSRLLPRAINDAGEIAATIRLEDEGGNLLPGQAVLLTPVK